MSPLVSLVIPSKNRPAEIARCLESVAAHSRGIGEIIVVDQSERPYALPDDPRILHLYRPDLGGLTAARNAGIEAAQGEIVLFVDDDCTFESDAAAEAQAALEAQPEAVGAQPTIIDPQLQAPPPSHRIFQHGFFASHIFERPGTTQLPRLSGCSMAFRTTLFAHERFDEALRGYGYGEDWDFSKRAQRHGTLVAAPGAQIAHRPSPNNRFDRRRLFATRWDNYRYIWQKLRAEARPIDRVWYWWWMFGETLQWLRLGYGLPPYRGRALG